MSTSGGNGGKTIIATTAAVGALVATVSAVFAYTNSAEYQSSSSSSNNWKRKFLDSFLTTSSYVTTKTSQMKSEHRRREKKMLTTQIWFAGCDEDGRIVNPEAMRKIIIEGGIESSLRQEVYPFLLNIRDPNDSAVEVEQAKQMRKVKYDALRKRCKELELMMKSGKAYSKDSLPPRDLGVFTENAPVIKADAPRTTFVYGEFAAMYDACDDTNAAALLEKDINVNCSGNKRDKKKKSWEVAQTERCQKILEAFALYDTTIGYCQGMNELAAGFLRDCVDESEAFWCFAHFTSGAFRSHFVISGHAHLDGGISERLLALSTILQICDKPLWKHLHSLNSENCMFAFRSVVVLLSRELDVSSTIFLWDVLMATRDYAPTVEATAMSAAAAVYEERNNSQFDGDSDILEVLTVGGGRLFLHVVAAAFLEMRHSVFSCKNYDDLLQLCNQMPAQQFSVSRLLEKAKVLLGKTRGVGEAKVSQNVAAATLF